MKRFETLDGLRGVAALMVVILHATQFFKASWTPDNAYLAVDFFFCLSGFVIAHAYDARLLSKMTLANFARRRFYRLYPMIFIGIVIGAIVVFIQVIVLRNLSVLNYVILVVSSLFILPSGLLFGMQAYPINNPMWSLFFESVANIAYAVALKLKLRLKYADYVMLFAMAGALLAISLHYNGLELVGFSDFNSFLAGFVRVAFPFYSGVLIFRHADKFATTFHSYPVIYVALIVMLIAPIHAMKGLYDYISVVFAIPLLVYFGSKANIPQAGVWISEFLGRLSYPLYLVHQPIIRILSHAYDAKFRNIVSPTIAMVIAILVSIGLAVLFLLMYDEPLRRVLSQKPKAAGR